VTNRFFVLIRAKKRAEKGEKILRVIPIGWPGLIGKYRSIFVGRSVWHNGSTPHVISTKQAADRASDITCVADASFPLGIYQTGNREKKRAWDRWAKNGEVGRGWAKKGGEREKRGDQRIFFSCLMPCPAPKFFALTRRLVLFAYLLLSTLMEVQISRGSQRVGSISAALSCPVHVPPFPNSGW